jgi:hypothetical protein
LAQRRKERARAFFWNGVIAATAGAGMAAVGGYSLRTGHTPVLLAVGVFCLIGGGLSILQGRRVSGAPLPEAAPAPEAVPDNAGTRLPLAERRRTWLIGAVAWVLSLVTAVALAGLLRDHAPPLARLGIFLCLPTAALALSSWQVRLRNGNTDWPR